MPGRKFTAGNLYRYGFNGKENDNEVKGEGNQQDYGMRIYDPRLGRFLSVDPLTHDYPELTPYQFASNTPIKAIDIDGEETSWRPNGQLKPAPDAYKFGAQSTCQTCGVSFETRRDISSTYQTPPFDANADAAQPKAEFNSATPKPSTPQQKAQLAKKEANGGFDDSFVLELIRRDNVVRSERRDANSFPFLGNALKAGRYELMGYHSEAGQAAGDLAKEAVVSYVGGKVIGGAIKYLKPAANTLPTGSFYSVAFESELPSSLYPGKSYYTHFKAANTALNNAMASDATFANSMGELGVTVPKTTTGTILGKSPTNWVWHHDVNSGIIQLVPAVQHTNGSAFWNVMHPGGKGGMSLWNK